MCKKTNTDVKIQNPINRPTVNNSRGTERTKRKGKEEITKKRKRNKPMSMRNREIVQYPLSQSGRKGRSIE